MSQHLRFRRFSNGFSDFPLSISESLIRAGIRHDEADKIAAEIQGADLNADQRATAEEELKTSRECQKLQQQIDLLPNRINDASKWIGLDMDQLRDTLSCSLELLKSSLRPGARANVPEVIAGRGDDKFPHFVTLSGGEPLLFPELFRLAGFFCGDRCELRFESPGRLTLWDLESLSGPGRTLASPRPEEANVFETGFREFAAALVKALASGRPELLADACAFRDYAPSHRVVSAMRLAAARGAPVELRKQEENESQEGT